MVQVHAPWYVHPLPVLEVQEDRAGHEIPDHPAERRPPTLNHPGNLTWIIFTFNFPSLHIKCSLMGGENFYSLYINHKILTTDWIT